ncbi:MAG: helix-turn-helix domain-containing protein [Bacteroidales bacterium]|nr:helix-turn-helix domain-containing protein [Bacteroidales bacterium]
MNRVVTNIITINAADNLADWLRSRCKETGTPLRSLSRATGITRSCLYRYLHGTSTPKLDTLAMLFSYFGETEIKISLKEPNNT